MTDDRTDLRPARLYRFGTFEADAATGELRRQGVRVKLNAQPFQVLLLLLERPGELLTRKEISRELWPDGTFVDYEHGVNSAINRIREALGDKASNPRFVVTLARRGYRFVAPVERIELNEDASAAVSESGEPVVEEQAAQQAEQSTVPAEPESSLRGRILATPQELPKASYRVVQTLFVLLQLMYVGFYVGALADLAEIDELWALAPFLLLHHMNYGLALACATLLVYSPFAQRSLVLMGASGADPATAAAAR